MRKAVSYTHLDVYKRQEQQTVPENSFGSDRWIYPTHYIAMSYTLTPEPMENISVFDLSLIHILNGQ